MVAVKKKKKATTKKEEVNSVEKMITICCYLCVCNIQHLFDKLTEGYYTMDNSNTPYECQLVMLSSSLLLLLQHNTMMIMMQTLLIIMLMTTMTIMIYVKA